MHALSRVRVFSNLQYLYLFFVQKLARQKLMVEHVRSMRERYMLTGSPMTWFP